MNSRGKEAAALLAPRQIRFSASRDLIAATAADPRGALLSDLDRPGAGFLAAKLPSSAAAARAVSDFRAEEQAKSKLAQRAKKEAEAGMASASDAAASTPTMSTPPKPSGPPLPQQIFENEAAARYEAAVGADIGFVERLVWFWSNQFCISADKDVAWSGLRARGDPRARARALRRHADRRRKPPGGRFITSTMSARWRRLDCSDGIDDRDKRESRPGDSRLHALGVRGGYSQADATCFAKVLTGWTSTDAADLAHGGEPSTSACTSRVSRPCSAGSMPKAVSIRAGAVLTDLAHRYGDGATRRTKARLPLCRR